MAGNKPRTSKFKHLYPLHSPLANLKLKDQICVIEATYGHEFGRNFTLKYAIKKFKFSVALKRQQVAFQFFILHINLK